MSADQEPLPVRDRAVINRVASEQAASNGTTPVASNGIAPEHVGTNGLASGNGTASGHATSNGVAPEHVATNGIGHVQASTNGTLPGRTFVAYDVDWDSCLPERSTGLAWRVGQRVKRLLDAVLASVMLVALLPLLLAVAVMVKLTSRGSTFYACEYVGRRGCRFVGYKFRTMVADAESKKAELLHLNHMKGPAFKIRRDPRITPLGRFLRKFSIDELPQLWNVVKGDMSLVGPRPPLPEEWAEFKDWQRAKLAVVPGITCTWQVNGRSDIVDFDEWARLDLQYIEGWSLWEDSKLLVRTIPAVLKGHGAY